MRSDEKNYLDDSVRRFRFQRINSREYRHQGRCYRLQSGLALMSKIKKSESERHHRRGSGELIVSVEQMEEEPWNGCSERTSLNSTYERILETFTPKPSNPRVEHCLLLLNGESLQCQATVDNNSFFRRKSDSRGTHKRADHAYNQLLCSGCLRICDIVSYPC
jgi:hypothetical protein